MIIFLKNFSKNKQNRLKLEVEVNELKQGWMASKAVGVELWALIKLGPLRTGIC